MNHRAVLLHVLFSAALFLMNTTIAQAQAGPPVPVTERTLQRQVNQQNSKILRTGSQSIEQGGILEQLQISNRLLTQLNNTIGMPSSVNMMLPVYIATATDTFAPFLGIDPKQSDGSTTKNLISIQDIGGDILGDLGGQALGEFGINSDTAENIFNLASAGNMSGGDILNLALGACGESCNFKVGDTVINPGNFYNGATKYDETSMLGIMYGGSQLCDIIATGKDDAKCVLGQGIFGDFIDGNTGDLKGDSALSTAFSILKGQGIFDKKKEQSVSGGSERNKINIMTSKQSAILTNALLNADPANLQDPSTIDKEVKKIQTARTGFSDRSTMGAIMQGTTIISGSPQIFDQLIKGNKSPGCHENLVKLDQKLRDSFQKGIVNPGKGNGGGDLRGDCVSLTNIMTHTRSLRGDVQAMIAVKYTDLLVTMASLYMQGTSSVAGGASSTLNTSISPQYSVDENKE
jgi:hypothetical protein